MQAKTYHSTQELEHVEAALRNYKGMLMNITSQWPIKMWVMAKNKIARQ